MKRRERSAASVAPQDALLPTFPPQNKTKTERLQPLYAFKSFL